MGVVLYRANFKAAAFLWDRRKDTFMLGQWLNARVHERLCDISPDGKHFLYYASDGADLHPKVYTAVSRAPYFKALAFFPAVGWWNGGAYFTGNATYRLLAHVKPIPSGVRLSNEVRLEQASEQDRTMPIANRLLRLGWTQAGDQDFSEWPQFEGEAKTLLDGATFFEQKLRFGWTMRKAHCWHPTVGDVDVHQLVRHETVTSIPAYEWADIDGDRFAYCSSGKLWVAPINVNGLGEPKELFDFNTIAFEPRVAPY